MSIARIENFHLSRRPMFSGIYGSGIDDIFIGPDLRRCNLYQALYRQFKAEGYTVLFYSTDTNYNLFSYSEDDLAAFFRLTNRRDEGTEGMPRRHIAQIDSPFGIARRQRRNAEPPRRREAVSHYEQIHLSELMSRPNDFFRMQVTVDVFDTIVKFAYQEPTHKLVVVFTTAAIDTFQNADQTLAKLTNLRADYTKLGLQVKLVAVYDCDALERLTENDGAFFLNKFFKEMLMPAEEPPRTKGGRIERFTSDYYLGQPSADEVANLLNRKRLTEHVGNTFRPIAFKRLCKLMTQEITQAGLLLRDVDSLDAGELTALIDKLDGRKALDTLNAMKGIDNIKAQFARYRQSLADSRSQRTGARFRPHMALMGSPGTGKSTVARLFGRILSDDGLLPVGHFVKVDVSELIGEYIGSTRPKTRAVCERARGGVLFIDEAYGLMSGSNAEGHVDYGKEAIEVLIQFMEDNDDSLVVLAGYTDEINNLLDNGNKGFRRRFNELGFFHFNDYAPEVLYDIAIGMVPVDYTDRFAKALRSLVRFKHAYRNKKFGNVGDMENMVSAIVGAYRQTGDSAPLDVVHLPRQLRLLVDPTMLDADTMLAPLNALVGQKEVKEEVRMLFNSILAERRKVEAIDGYMPEMRSLNYIFTGNPGTGKTTVARILGQMLQSLGILQSNEADPLIETRASELLNLTPAQIRELFERAIGRVLIIDEAYELRSNPRVLTDIVGNITNKDYEKKMCLILAGYSHEMKQMLQLNSGSARRFETIGFSDYTNEELFEILKRLVDNPKTQALMDADACRPRAMRYFESIPRDRSFGNAGIVTDKLIKVLKAHRDLRYNSAAADLRLTEDFAKRILPEDFPDSYAP